MASKTTRRVRDSTFTLLANGSMDAPPASGLLEFLLERGARRVTSIYHPLSAEQGDRHELITYERGREPRRRVVRLPSSPPYTYPLDLLVPLWQRRTDGWFAFNNLLCARGLIERRIGRAGKVVYWAVDFVPDRFGQDALLTRVYDAVDRYCCRHADLRVDLSQAALEGRDQRHGLGVGGGAPSTVAPIGAWLKRTPQVGEDGWQARKVVFMGHLVERMGADTAIDAVALLAERGVDVSAEIVGRGPVAEQLREQAARRGIENRVRFHGFIEDHRELERVLAQASVAVAPYSTRVESFTRFADPGKLKSYLAAGLPILLTDVPPNAGELAERGGAQIVADDPAAFADAIERSLADADGWRARRAAALAHAKLFDWDSILPRVLRAAGFEA